MGWQFQINSLALTVLSVLFVAGCQTKPLTALTYAEQTQMINQILAKCAKQGVKSGTQEEKDCFKQEVYAEQYRRGQNARTLENTRVAVGNVSNAMMVAGTQSQPAFKPSPVTFGQPQVVYQVPPPTLSQTVNSTMNARKRAY